MYTSPGPDVADHDAIYSEQKPDAAERTRRYERRGGSQARHRPRPQTYTCSERACTYGAADGASVRVHAHKSAGVRVSYCVRV